MPPPPVLKPSALDYPAVLADLERRHAEIGAAITAIRLLCGTSARSIEAPVLSRKRAKGRPKARAAKAARGEKSGVGDRSSPLDDLHAKALTMAQAGKSRQEIAAACGVKYSTVWNWSQKPDWPKAA